MKRLILQAVIILIGNISLAQIKVNPVSSEIKPLKIGDKLPNYTLPNVKKWKSSTLKLSDLKGKLIIFDFWNRWCSSCIAAFPKMQNLQEIFGDKIQIILVTTDTEKDYNWLLDKSEVVRDTRLPIIVADTLLKKIFPHTTVPYHVWIDTLGNLKFTTEGANTTKTNIENYFKKPDFQIPIRTDIMDMNLVSSALIKGSPLIKQLMDDRNTTQLESYSLITRRSKISARSMGYSFIDTLENGDVQYCKNHINTTATSLFNSIFSKDGASENGSGRNFIVEYKNPQDSLNSKYFIPGNKEIYGKWVEDNTYCYELKLPPFPPNTSKEEIEKRIQKKTKRDIEDFFNVTTRVEERYLKCIVFTSKDGVSPKIISKTEYESFTRLSDGTVLMTNYPLKNIQYLLDNKQDNMLYVPRFNETNFKGRIDLRIKSCNTIEELDKELEPYGIDVKFEYRKFKCGIVKEL